MVGVGVGVKVGVGVCVAAGESNQNPVKLVVSEPPGGVKETVI